MKWIKKGLIFTPPKKDWMWTHATTPTPFVINDERVRIYVGFRDKNNITRIGYVDFNSDFSEILEISKEPVLDIGKPGNFDDSGVFPSSVVEFDEKIYLYYWGMRKGNEEIRHTLFCGLAISKDGKFFKRYSDHPILKKSKEELFIRSAAFVIKEGRKWKMWYPASVGNNWPIKVNGKSYPKEIIKYLESENGIDWGETGVPCINFKNEDEYILARPSVFKQDGKYHMFYSIRKLSNNGYRLGYAQSLDGKIWTRKDEEAGIDVSKEGWDSQEICYGVVINLKGKNYLIYCGNNYGEEGFGLAVEDK
jgi:predicted GH43/DUF377 family glycosyl hydrolase